MGYSSVSVPVILENYALKLGKINDPENTFQVDDSIVFTFPFSDEHEVFLHSCEQVYVGFKQDQLLETANVLKLIWDVNSVKVGSVF